MDKPKRKDLLDYWARNVCPNCEKAIPEGTLVGGSKKSKGGFCSLDCYAEYHELDLRQTAARVSAIH